MLLVPDIITVEHSVVSSESQIRPSLFSGNWHHHVFFLIIIYEYM